MWSGDFDANLNPALARNELIDMWGVTETPDESNLIQLRINDPSIVPEPSTGLLAAFGGISLLARRKRKTV